MHIQRQPLSEHLIRPMGPRDLDEVLDIERACFAEPWSRGLFESELENPVASAYTLRLDPDGPVAAYIVFWVVLGEAHVLNLSVAQGRRRRGLASVLLDDALDKMRASMVYEVFLEVRDSNRAARRLYEKFGFSESFVRKRYYGDEDAIVMALRLGPGA